MKKMLIDPELHTAIEDYWKVLQAVRYSNKSLKPFPANGFTYRAEVNLHQNRSETTPFAGTSITVQTLTLSPKNTSYPLLLYTALSTTGANRPGFYFCLK